MQVEVTRGFRRKATASPTNKDGSPGKIDGILNGRLAGSGPGAGTPTPLVTPVPDDPLSAYINGVGDAASTETELFADARLGPEVREIVIPVTVSVKDQEAENLGLVVGDEEPIPPATPA